MRLRNIPGAKEEIEKSRYSVSDVKEYKGKWNEVFGNNNKIYVEIGMGKGAFIIENAIRYPDINFIGIEKYHSVLVRAVQKAENMELNNLRLISMKAEEINEVFGKHEIDKIYLNFSDPWPKARHSNRRLTAPGFLEKYDEVLSPQGNLEFKTDNDLLFDFTLEVLEDSKWNIEYVTRDLHSDVVMVESNIMTEYETKFVSLGNHINKVTISR